MEVTEQVTEMPKKEASLVSIGTTGALAFQNQMELATASRLMIKMRTAPAQLITEGLEAVMSALLFCKQFNLPVTAMNELGYIKGKITAYGSLVTALAERHPDYGDKDEFFINQDGERICSENKNIFTAEPWAHIMRLRKKGSDTWTEFNFSLRDAEQAGLFNKSTNSTSPWSKYTKDMLMHKNKSRAYKSYYASALNGINYHEDIAFEREVTPSLADELNKTYVDEVKYEGAPL